MLLSFFLVFVLQYFLPSFVNFSLIHYLFLLPNLLLHTSSSLLSTFSSIFVICLPSLSTLPLLGPLHCILSIPFFSPSFLISLCLLHICPSSFSLQVSFTPLTSYSLKWENGLIMTVQASQLKSHGVDSVCTYKKSKHCKEGKKSHLSRAHNLQKSL